MLFCVNFVTRLLLVCYFLPIFAAVTKTKQTMGRKQQIKVAKEPVKIRLKTLANGNQSIYLDIYHNGKRSYEFLKLYLVPVTGANKQWAAAQNSNTMDAANAIKAKRIIELANGVAGIKKSDSGKMLLVEWMDDFMSYKDNVARGDSYVKNIIKVRKRLIDYKGKNVRMADVDKAFCEGFILYLKNAKSFKDGETPLSKQSQLVYYSVFNTAMRKAVRDGVILSNPMDKVGSDAKPKATESTKVYLDKEELAAMIESECGARVKGAFLFSCFCGLRISDVRNLKWGDLKAVESPDGTLGYYLSIVMQKTQRGLSYRLSNEALKWLPDRNGKDDGERVFSLPIETELNRQLKAWAKRAGVDKNISFHTARHTFATLMLTIGADLYTTSKLLGHTNIKTTQVYAKIVDQKKDEAMRLLDGLF